jgi:hypothetical protein
VSEWLVDPGDRVCPRCGRPAAGADTCECDANLAAMRDMLPTREQRGARPAAQPPASEQPVAADRFRRWEAAAARFVRQPPEADPTPDAPVAAADAEPQPRTRSARRILSRVLSLLLRTFGLRTGPGERGAGPGPATTRRNQMIASAGVILVFVIILIAGSGSSGEGKKPATTPAASTPTTASAPAAVAGPSVNSCATAWNGGTSATHRHILDLGVVNDSPAVAVIATYAGASASLKRFGGGSPVLIAQNACIVIADDSLFIQQPSGNWGWIKAAEGYPFARIAADPKWTLAHANVSVAAGPLSKRAANLGAVTRSHDTLVILTDADLGRPG